MNKSPLRALMVILPLAEGDSVKTPVMSPTSTFFETFAAASAGAVPNAPSASAIDPAIAAETNRRMI